MTCLGHLFTLRGCEANACYRCGKVTESFCVTSKNGKQVGACASQLNPLLHYACDHSLTCFNMFVGIKSGCRLKLAFQQAQSNLQRQAALARQLQICRLAVRQQGQTQVQQKGAFTNIAQLAKASQSASCSDARCAFSSSYVDTTMAPEGPARALRGATPANSPVQPLLACIARAVCHNDAPSASLAICCRVLMTSSGVVTAAATAPAQPAATMLAYSRLEVA